MINPGLCKQSQSFLQIKKGNTKKILAQAFYHLYLSIKRQQELAAVPPTNSTSFLPQQPWANACQHLCFTASAWLLREQHPLPDPWYVVGGLCFEFYGVSESCLVIPLLVGWTNSLHQLALLVEDEWAGGLQWPGITPINCLPNKCMHCASLQSVYHYCTVCWAWWKQIHHVVPLWSMFQTSTKVYCQLKQAHMSSNPNLSLPVKLMAA